MRTENLVLTNNHQSLKKYLKSKGHIELHTCKYDDQLNQPQMRDKGILFSLKGGGEFSIGKTFFVINDEYSENVQIGKLYVDSTKNLIDSFPSFKDSIKDVSNGPVPKYGRLNSAEFFWVYGD